VTADRTWQVWKPKPSDFDPVNLSGLYSNTPSEEALPATNMPMNFQKGRESCIEYIRRPAGFSKPSFGCHFCQQRYRSCEHAVA
jgi:hypothetical protein